MGVIYGIKNDLTGKIIYVGQASSFEKRKTQHLRNARIAGSSCRKLYAIMNKYGVDNFTFFIIRSGINNQYDMRHFEGLYARMLLTLHSFGQGGANLRDPWEESEMQEEWNERRIAALSGVYSTEAWKKSHKEGTQRRSQNTEWKRKLKESSQRLANDPVWHEKLKTGIQKRARNQCWKTNVSEACRKRSNDPEWIEKIRQGSKKRQKPIVCIETGKVYCGVIEAQRKTGLHASTLSKVCKGKLETTGGFHWRYATTEEAEKNHTDITEENHE